jgi:hypothetical protein
MRKKETRDIKKEVTDFSCLIIYEIFFGFSDPKISYN